jgi:hypothetical protein
MILNFILDNIPFQPDLPALVNALHGRPNNRHRRDIERLAAEAQAIARPRAFYKVAAVDQRGTDSVVIDSITFRSRILTVNLEQIYRVFPFVATGGVELDEWVTAKEDMLDNYYAGALAELALRSAIQAVVDHITENFRPDGLSQMNPGSLADWPLYEQKPLFALLGDSTSAIGVSLQPSMLMSPTKSVSGIWFPLAESFASCQLCPMPDCPGRRAPYDPDLAERKYGIT